MTGHCAHCYETACVCDGTEQRFWCSVENDQSCGPCLVTDGNSIQYAFFTGDTYLGCNFKQKEIIAWYPIYHPKIPDQLMTLEQTAIISMSEDLEDLKTKMRIMRDNVRPLIQEHRRNHDKKS